MGRKPTHERISLHMLRLSKLPPAQFRVLLHGVTYETGWNPALCAKECGLSLLTVQRAYRTLQEGGYVYHVPHPFKRKQKGSRFRLAPLLPDEKKPWYEDMVAANDGCIKGVVFGQNADALSLDTDPER